MTNVKKIYKLLKKKGLVKSDLFEFENSVIIFDNPHELFDFIYGGNEFERYLDMDKSIVLDLFNEVLRYTPQDLKGYTNVADRIVRNHDLVKYIEELDVYIFVKNEAILSNVA